MKNTGTHMVMIDEFQHFYDKHKHQIMYRVADWLKVLIDETKTTLVVAGLPQSSLVIEANEQLARRFLAPIQLPRFWWTNAPQRKQFIAILAAFNKKIAGEYDMPEMHSEDMAFRYFCATGGFLSNLTKLLRQALRTANTENTRKIRLEDLYVAHQRAMILRPVEPFARGFYLSATEETLDKVGTIGKPQELAPTARRRVAKSRVTESAHSMLTTS